MKDRKAAIGFGAFVAGVVVASLVVVMAVPGGAAHPGNRKYQGIVLNGAQEVPPADVDGIGDGKVLVKGKTGKVCVLLKKIGNIDAATAAHIHEGAVGVDGPIVFDLVTPALKGKKYQKSKTCGFPSAAVVAGLQNSPEDYYLNVHNATWPGGAIRGQIG